MTDPTAVPLVTFRRPRPSPDEVPSTVTVRRYRARSTGINCGGVWVIGPVLAEVHVRRWEGDAYRATASVHVDGRHQFGEPAEFLDADGLPKGGPLTDWCELVTPAPAVEGRHTGELVEGDVIRLHGMRLRLGPLAEHSGPYGPFWNTRALVLNLAEVEAAAAADPASDAAFVLRFVRADGGTWTVQGNRLARWSVEVPAARLVWHERPGVVAAAAERLAGEVDAHGFASERYGVTP